MGRRLARFAVAAALALGAVGTVGALAPSASAQATGQSSGPGFICSTTSSATSPSSSDSGPYLPIDRWAGVAGSDLHTRLSGGFFGVSDLGQEANRELQSLALSVGNTLWQGGTDLVGLAGEFCFAGQVGVAVDHAAAAIGQAVSSSGLLVAVVVAVIVVVLWRRHKLGESPWGALARMAVVLGVLVAMLAGASATRLGKDGQADFGTFSPGWLVDKVYGTVSSLASAPTKLLASQPTGLTGLASQGPASCGAYVGSLVKDYKDSYGTSPTSQVAASLPVALNDMWEQAGLATYTEVQFGAANPYGAWAYCHQLDFNAGFSSSQQAQVAAQSLPPGTPLYPSALAWPGPGAPNPTVDASVIGWAACEGYPGHWAIPASWASTGVTPSVCDQWWTSAGVPSALDWGTSTSRITQAASNAPQGAALAGFLLNYHGDANGTADAAAITYAASSLVVFAVFALLAGAVLVAKVALLVVTLLLAAVALLSVWPGGSQGRLGQVARYALGLIVFATGAQLILALVALVTGIVSEMVASLAGQGSFLDVLAMGLAPVGAVYILHFVFTKVLKAPSPFKLSGALAWAASAGAIGAGVANAVDRNLDQRGLALARSAKTAVLARYGTPRPERMGAMRPAGDPSAGATSATSAAKAQGGIAGAVAAVGGAVGGAVAQRRSGQVTPAAPGPPGGGGRQGPPGATGAAPGAGGAGPVVGAPARAANGAAPTDGRRPPGTGGAPSGPRPAAWAPSGSGEELTGKNPHAVALGRLGAQARYGRAGAPEGGPARAGAGPSAQGAGPGGPGGTGASSAVARRPGEGILGQDGPAAQLGDIDGPRGPRATVPGPGGAAPAGALAGAATGARPPHGPGSDQPAGAETGTAGSHGPTSELPGAMGPSGEPPAGLEAATDGQGAHEPAGGAALDRGEPVAQAPQSGQDLPGPTAGSSYGHVGPAGPAPAVPVGGPASAGAIGGAIGGAALAGALAGAATGARPPSGPGSDQPTGAETGTAGSHGPTSELPGAMGPSGELPGGGQGRGDEGADALPTGPEGAAGARPGTGDEEGPAAQDTALAAAPDARPAPTRAGSALWREVEEDQQRGGPSTADQVEAEWSRLSPDEARAATQAGTALWANVARSGAGAATPAPGAPASAPSPQAGTTAPPAPGTRPEAGRAAPGTGDGANRTGGEQEAVAPSPAPRPNRQAGPGTARSGAMGPSRRPPSGTHDAGEESRGSERSSSAEPAGPGPGVGHVHQDGPPLGPGHQEEPGHRGQSPQGTGLGQEEAGQPGRPPTWRRAAAQRHQAERQRRQAERIGRALLTEAEGGPRARARAAVNDRARLAWERARHKPASAGLRALKTGATAGAMVAAGVVATATAPLGLGVAAVYAGHKALRWKAEAPARKAEREERRQAALAAYQARYGGLPRPGEAEPR